MKVKILEINKEPEYKNPIARFQILIGDEPFELCEWINDDGTLEQIDSHIKVCQPETFAMILEANGTPDDHEILWDALNEAMAPELSICVEIVADRIFKQANHSTGFTGADWAVTTWILGNNHFLCDDENGHHTIVYRDDETELEGVPREVRKMTNTECIDWLLAGADLSKLGGES